MQPEEQSNQTVDSDRSISVSVIYKMDNGRTSEKFKQICTTVMFRFKKHIINTCANIASMNIHYSMLHTRYELSLKSEPANLTASLKGIIQHDQ